MSTDSWPMHRVPSGGMRITPTASPEQAVRTRIGHAGEGTPATLVASGGMAVFVVNPEALPSAWRVGVAEASCAREARNTAQPQCENCHSFNVQRHSSTTKGRIRPDTKTFISQDNYAALLSRGMGVGMAIGVVGGIVLAGMAFQPLLAMYHEPLSNAPLTGLSMFAIILLVTVGVSGAIILLQLGPVALKRWSKVTQRLSYYQCEQCGRVWERQESYTPPIHSLGE